MIHILAQYKKKLCGPFLWMGFNSLKARITSRRQFTFYHEVPRNSWYSFYWPQRDERLSQPWSHPVVLNTGPLDWESSALTTRPLLHCFYCSTVCNPRKSGELFFNFWTAFAQHIGSTSIGVCLYLCLFN